MLISILNFQKCQTPENLQKYKEKLLELDTGTNGIKNIYNKMSNMYYFIEEY